MRLLEIRRLVVTRRVNDADNLNSIATFAVENKVIANRKKPKARREIGAKLPNTRVVREPPTFGFKSIYQSRCSRRIPCADVMRDLLEVAVCLGCKAWLSHASGARSLTRTESREDLIRIDQFTALCLFNTTLDFTNQFVAPQRTNVISLLDPLCERETVIRRQLCGFALELFDGHAGKYIIPSQRQRPKLVAAPPEQIGEP